MKVAAVSLLAALGSAAAFSPSGPSFGVSRSAVSSTELFERKPFITGNWKLNPQSKDEAVELAKGIASSITSDSPCDAALFVPFPFIESVMEAVDGKLKVGAEVRISGQINCCLSNSFSLCKLTYSTILNRIEHHEKTRTAHLFCFYTYLIIILTFPAL